MNIDRYKPQTRHMTKFVHPEHYGDFWVADRQLVDRFGPDLAINLDTRLLNLNNILIAVWQGATDSVSYELFNSSPRLI